MKISWRLAREAPPPAEEMDVIYGYVGRWHCATIYPPGTWWTWNRSGVSGENARDSDIITAMKEAEAAINRRPKGDWT